MNLFESLSDIVFHSTRIPNLINILKTNTFVLSTSMGTKSDKDLDVPGYDFFMSLSNVKEGGYDKGMSPDVKLVLDGRKFNQRYKSKPVEYWGTTFHNAAKERAEKLMAEQGKLSKSQLREQTRYDENESRLFSTKSTIPNAKSYIKEIHILFDRNPRKSTVEELMKLTADIPTYSYVDKEDFATMNKAKSTKMNVDEYEPESEYNYQPYEHPLEYIKGLYDWCHGIKDSDEVKSIVRSYSWDRESAITAEIHNVKKDPKALKMMEQISWYMRKKKYTSITQLINEIVSYYKQKNEEAHMEYVKQQKAEQERAGLIAAIDEQLNSNPKAFFNTGDVDPYTYGGILFFKDEKGRIEAVALEEVDEDDKVNFTRISYEDPSTLDWVDWSNFEVKPEQATTLEDKLQLFADAVNHYGVENFGSYGYEKRNKADIMYRFPTEMTTGEEIMRERESAAG